MSDALTSASTPAPASTTQAPSAPAEQAPSSTPASQPSSTPQQPTADARPPRVNLHEVPEFKQWQAQVNRTMAQYQQQAAAAAAELERQKLSGMDDLEQAQYRASQLEAQVRQYQQQMEYQQLQMQRNADIEQIRAETGAPRELIEGAETFADAWRLAAKWQREQVDVLAKTRAAELKERAEANAVDIGGGTASTPLSRNEKAMAEAFKNMDSREFLRRALYGDE